LLTTDAIRFSGQEAGAPAIREGVGAPIILKMPGRIDPATYDPETESFTKRYRNVTAVVRVDDSQAEITLLDPLAVDTIRFAGRRWPLAADFTSVASLSVATDRPDRLGFSRLIRPEHYANTASLIPAQPYDPKRIPVLLVHGLESSTVTWFPMYQELMRDPVIRKNYQFWLFSYPSGYPYPYSAQLLRKELERVRRKHPDHKDIVLVGHSMGGVINRLILLNPGDQIWRSYFGKPPSDTDLDGESRQIIEDAFVFNAQPNVSRAVFFSAPHRGSELAVSWIGRLGSRLVRTPALFADIRDSVVNVLKNDDAALLLNRPANSIDTLSPDDSFVVFTKDLPISGGVPYHSVMGNRGKSVRKEQSSDGVVAYWSSHIDGAQSERLVPSGHSSHCHPEGIEEMRRILRLHLKP
jgi:pimeloyl-ACP methyl ester carboxylesterase